MCAVKVSDAKKGGEPYWTISGRPEPLGRSFARVPSVVKELTLKGPMRRETGRRDVGLG